MILEQNSGFKGFMKSTPVTGTLIILVSLVFLITSLSGGLSSDPVIRVQTLREFGALDTARVYNNNEFWRFFTVMFLHADIMHFIFNTGFGLFLISSALERMIGPKKFALIYFLSGIGASIVVYGYDILITRQASFGVGASGAIYGVLGTLLYLTIYKRDWFSPRDISSIRSLILINVVFTFIVPNISTSAHLGGLASGFILASLLNPSRYYSGRSQGFNDPYDPYAQERKQFNPDEDPFDYIEIIDDDDDDDRRVW